MSATSHRSYPSAPASSGSEPSGELLALPQLEPSELESLARLEEACRLADGGRLKLEWATLRSRPRGTTSDFVWMIGGEVVGFLGLYHWRHTEIEMCGMVHPAHRRRGIGSRLYEAASGEIARRSPPRALLIVDRATEAGQRFALARGGELDHSEHRMQQRREPEVREGTPEVRLSPASRADAPFVSSCLAAAFEEEEVVFFPADDAVFERLITSTLVIEDAETAERVGVMRVERDAAAASIYAFAVEPERQGRGFGRAALSQVTRQLRRSGVGVVSLEVLAHNDGALHLYRTCGFDSVGIEDYFAMPVLEAAQLAAVD